MAVEYRLLGPVEAWRDDTPLAIGGPKPRTVLAVLLVNLGQVVSSEALIDHVWGDDPPSTARNLLHGYVSHLRSVLAEPELRTRHPGYVLGVPPDRIDARRFERTVRSAEAALARGAAAAAADLLRRALELWRGPALGGVTSRALTLTAGAALDEARLRALELRVDADLRAGRDEDVLGELRTLVAMHPLRSGLRRRLMTALHASGRRGEALEVYESGRRALLSELGVEPDPELRQLEHRVRAADPSPAPAAVVAGPPGQLPPTIADFTGRRAEEAALSGLLSRGGGTPRVCVVTGLAGVGKTTLAVQVAHRLRRRFPDGQLFVDLDGVGQRPPRAVTVLASLLRGLGVDGAAIPPGLAERVALYRARLADRRVLVLLDNAAGEAQVRPLLPSGGGCGAIVTSRMPLSGLEAARGLPLAVLATDEAVSLLAAVAGADRVAAEPEAAADIVGLCGCLPLAVRIAGARLVRRPRRRLAAFAARLGDERRRLDELRAGDLEVRASLALSCRALGPAERRAFRLLAVVEAPDLPAWLAAALLDLDPPAAEPLLERLVDANLVDVADDRWGQARYRFHGLVRLLARELSEREDDEATRRNALERALAAELTLSERAHRALSPGNANHLSRGTAARWCGGADEVHAVVDADPLAWYEQERPCLVAGVEQASRCGHTAHAWELACSLTTFFGIRGHWQDWRATHEQAIAAARHGGDRLGEAQALEMLGVCNLWLGEVAPALSCFEQSLALARELREPRREATGLYGIGVMAAYRGDVDEAVARIGRSLAYFRATGDPHGQAVVLHSLGEAERLGGRLVEATDALGESQRIFRDIGDRHWEAIALMSLADCHRAARRSSEATDSLTQSLAVFRAVGNRHFAALSLYRLAKLEDAAGRLERARACLEQCAGDFAVLGLRLGEARALHRLGRVLAGLGDPAGAAGAWVRALAVFRELGAADAAAVGADLEAIRGIDFQGFSRALC